MISPKRILIVEDELVLQLMLAHMLKKMGHEELTTASKGREAIELCENKDFDVILMDIILQDNIDGIEAYRKISKKKDIPVIYITGNTDPKNMERAKRYGYHDYLAKPVTFPQLKNIIEELFQY